MAISTDKAMVEAAGATFPAPDKNGLIDHRKLEMIGFPATMTCVGCGTIIAVNAATSVLIKTGGALCRQCLLIYN